MLNNSFNAKIQNCKVKYKSVVLPFYFLLFTLKTLRLCVSAGIFFTVFLSVSCQKSVEPIRKPFSKVTTLNAVNEKIGEPFGIAVKADEIYVADGDGGKILKISKAGIISVLTDKLDTPSNIVFDKNGDLIVFFAASFSLLLRAGGSCFFSARNTSHFGSPRCSS